MTAPNAFLVDVNSTITPKIGIAVDPTTGAPSLLTVDGNGNQVTTLAGGSGSSPASSVSPKAAGAGAVGTATPYARQDHVHPVNTAADVGAVAVVGPYATPAALATAVPATSGNAGTQAKVGSGVPYAFYFSDGVNWCRNAVNQGTPLAVSGTLTLSNGLDGENLVCSSTPVLTINSGLIAGYGNSIKGTFTTTGSATITDLRATTGTAFCSLVQSDTTGAGTTYDLVGTK